MFPIGDFELTVIDLRGHYTNFIQDAELKESLLIRACIFSSNLLNTLPTRHLHLVQHGEVPEHNHCKIQS